MHNDASFRHTCQFFLKDNMMITGLSGALFWLEGCFCPLKGAFKHQNSPFPEHFPYKRNVDLVRPY